MAPSSSRTGQPGWTRFALGCFVCTAVSDGPLDLKQPMHKVLVDGDGGEIGATEIADLLTAD